MLSNILTIDTHAIRLKALNWSEKKYRMDFTKNTHTLAQSQKKNNHTYRRWIGLHHSTVGISLLIKDRLKISNHQNSLFNAANTLNDPLRKNNWFFFVANEIYFCMSQLQHNNGKLSLHLYCTMFECAVPIFVTFTNPLMESKFDWALQLVDALFGGSCSSRCGWSTRSVSSSMARSTIDRWPIEWNFFQLYRLQEYFEGKTSICENTYKSPTTNNIKVNNKALRKYNAILLNSVRFLYAEDESKHTMIHYGSVLVFILKFLTNSSEYSSEDSLKKNSLTFSFILNISKIFFICFK